jgi:NADPH-dependent 2,4-dienoyl-CoA reductase/sulfur reductase-like enzyme
MAAAIRAAEAGVSVALLDEHPEAGGVVWRGLVGASGARKQSLARDYPTGFTMLDQLEGAKLARIFGATIWEVTRDRVISYSQGGTARQLAARRIILATGALERPMPFPGWTLPGVLTAGAAQIMLKTSGLTPPGPIVMAGSGPLLYLVAAQLLEAGQPPAAIVDTTPRENWLKALHHIPLRASAWRMIARWLSWQRKMRRSGVGVHRGASDLVALGDRQISGVRFQCRGQAVDLPCATLLLHSGVVPNVQLTRAIGLDHFWDELGQAWHPHTDDMGRTRIDGILIAGDGAGISGAEAAVHSGRLAALAALDRLAEISDEEIGHERKARARYLPVRPFLDCLTSALVGPNSGIC